MAGQISRILALLTIGSAALAGAPGLETARATPAQWPVQAYFDPQLAPIFGGAMPNGAWRPGALPDMAAQVCASREDMSLVITQRALTDSERKACEKAGRGSVFETLIGAIVIVPVAQPGAFAQLQMRHLFEAVASETSSGQPNRRATWREIDPSLPDAPIKLLLPAAGSPEDSLLSTALMRFCLAERPAPAGANAAERIARCAQLRNDAAVAYRSQGQSASEWLSGAGRGGVALVGYGQLAADAKLTGILPLDGALAQADIRARGDYPMSQQVYFVASHTRRHTPEQMERAIALADSVLAEATIGPEGGAARAGLAPLSAAERIALRKDFTRFLAKGGLWSGLWE